MSAQGDDRRAGQGAPPPLACDVGIVAALPIEVGFLIDRLKDVRRYSGAAHEVIEGEAMGKVIAVLVGGPGRNAARTATELLLDGHHPRWIISAGFGGALDPLLRCQDAVFPNEICDPEGNRLQVDVRVDFAEQDQGPRVVTGRLVTVDAIARTPSEKAALRDRHGADVVDMETSAVAAVCAQRRVRFLSIRVISDEATAELPIEVATLMNRKGARLAGSALRAIWNRPSSLKDFWALHSTAQESADRLADVTLAAIAHLPA
ncbi:MAG: nucleoside phosphorylase, partial [Isosphaeraceae bacterium]